MQAPKFNGALMAEDLKARGWQPIDMARRCGVANSTVTRFLRGESQSPRMCKRFAKALGHPLRRYLLDRGPVQVVYVPAEQEGV